MLPPNDQIANQSCSFGQQKMAALFGVVEKYTHSRFQLSESVPLTCQNGMTTVGGWGYLVSTLFATYIPVVQNLSTKLCVMVVHARLLQREIYDRPGNHIITDFPTVVSYIIPDVSRQ